MTNAKVFQINVSKGGVPKLPIHNGEVAELGLINDVQKNKKHHGGSERALCLYSLDRILALQDEGHPIFPGAIGENITISGLDWDDIGPGVRLQLGEVQVEITSFAVPCQNIRQAFSGHKIGRVSQKANPGWARAYCKILVNGRIQVSDPVSIL